MKAGREAGQLGLAGATDPSIVKEWEDWLARLPVDVESHVRTLTREGTLPLFSIPTFKRGGEGGRATGVADGGASSVETELRACILDHLQRRFQVDSMSYTREEGSAAKSRQVAHSKELAEMQELAQLQLDAINQHSNGESLKDGSVVVVAYCASPNEERGEEDKCSFAVAEVVDGNSGVKGGPGDSLFVKWYECTNMKDVWTNTRETLLEMIEGGQFAPYSGSGEKQTWVPLASVLVRDADLTKAGSLSRKRRNRPSAGGTGITTSTVEELRNLVKLGILCKYKYTQR